MSRYIGQRLKRTEDPRLIQGIGHYVDDIRLPDTLHVAVLRSPYAHAEIASIDVSAAKALPGVVAVVTGADVAEAVGPVPCASEMPGLNVPRHTILATGRVYFAGHPVAAVVATDKYIARDAIDLIEADYSPIEPVLDVEAAAQPGSPVIHEEFGTNIAFVHKFESGDLESAFNNADRVITQKLVHQRLLPVPMEPRGVLARYQPGEHELTIWSSTQVPHILRTQLAFMLGLPENRVRVIAPEVGGGFGCKLNVYAEEALAGYLSMKLCKPVKWIESRRENLQSTIHGRGQQGEVQLAVKNDGTFLGLRYNVLVDIGSYHQLFTPTIPTLTGLMLSGCYRIPAICMSMQGVFTNKMATDAYRGAGRPEATYLIERIVSLAAAELGIDPVEIRKKNFPQPEEFPFATATGLMYDSGNYQAALAKALEMAGYDKLREEQKAARANGRYIGIGVSTYVEICAIGPSASMPAGGWESATVRIDPTCKVTVLTGASPHGQGQETSFAQIAADYLGVKMDDVVVIHGDTAIVQYGIGTFGSRATAVGGTAMVNAIGKLIEKAKKFAAVMLGAGDGEVTFEDGKFTAPGGKSVTIQEVALSAHVAKALPAGEEPGLVATSFFEPPNFTFPFGTHIAVVEVDRESGEVKILRYIAVDDCGNVINPLLVDGQVHGGITQGLSQALFEEAVYDDGGQLITGSLMDYVVPKAHQVPHFECGRTETPTNVNPMGIKGVGEAGTIGSTPAIANAVIDALSPFGVKHADLPLKPEKLWRLMNQVS